MTRPIGTAAELERRRRHAVELIEQGESPGVVARILGVHPKSVSRWCHLARLPGGLHAKPQTGPRPGLSDAQLRQLEQLLLDGPKAHGCNNALWTAARVAPLIHRFFALSYPPEHLPKFLKRRLGWPSEKPRREARPRD